jgi:hypothetical protein
MTNPKSQTSNSSAVHTELCFYASNSCLSMLTWLSDVIIMLRNNYFCLFRHLTFCCLVFAFSDTAKMFLCTTVLTDFFLSWCNHVLWFFLFIIRGRFKCTRSWPLNGVAIACHGFTIHWVVFTVFRNRTPFYILPSPLFYDFNDVVFKNTNLIAFLSTFFPITFL